jgi:hypothetical protein
MMAVDHRKVILHDLCGVQKAFCSCRCDAGEIMLGQGYTCVYTNATFYNRINMTYDGGESQGGHPSKLV